MIKGHGERGMMSHEYEETRRIVYSSDEIGEAHFIPVCKKCGRYVKAFKTLNFRNDGKVQEPNANCKKCGKTSMLFEGYF